MVTAKTDRIDHRLGMVLGVDDFITKPFRVSDLLDGIDARLRLNRLRQQIASPDKSDPIFISYKRSDWDDYVKDLVEKLKKALATVD